MGSSHHSLFSLLTAFAPPQCARHLPRPCCIRACPCVAARTRRLPLLSRFSCPFDRRTSRALTCSLLSLLPPRPVFLAHLASARLARSQLSSFAHAWLRTLRPASQCTRFPTTK